MIRSVNAGFGDPVDSDALRALVVTCPRLMLRRPDGQGDPVARVREAQEAGLRPLWLVTQLADVAALPIGAWAEWLNEPDHTALAPASYAWQIETMQRERPDVTWWAGSLSNLTFTALDWLASMLGCAPTVSHISVHRYPPVWVPEQAHEGFASRDEEVAGLRAVIGARPFIVSEFGYHLGSYRTGCFGWRVKRHTEAQQRDAFAYEWAFWTRHGATLACAYQLNDGPTDTAIDRYGLRDGTGRWRLAAATLREE